MRAALRCCVILVMQLNGKQVRHLCCPRNGQRVWVGQYATVNFFMGRRPIKTCEPGYRPKSHVQEMLREAHEQVFSRHYFGLPAYSLVTFPDF
jgi:hypothetical protein